MEWSPQQLKALHAAKDWLDNPGDKKVFRLFGYAGTGKSTLAKTIGLMEAKRGGYAQFAAFTGKAAVVMKRKGCENARTLHSIIYTSHDKSKEDLDGLTGALVGVQDPARKAELEEQIIAEKEKLNQPAFSLKPDALTVWDEGDYGERRPVNTITLFIIDECSMVDAQLGADLLSFGARVLVMGDPAQLPPVMGGGYFTNTKPDVLLTEIHRQALDSPIIKIADGVRRGNGLLVADYGHGCRVVKASELTAEDWMAADQILCGKNETRHSMNKRIRELKGFHGILPEPGEKLVCLRNNPKEGFLNGSLWTTLEVEDRPNYHNFWLKVESLDDPGRILKCLAHKACFFGDELNPWERKDANEFNFGYVLTVHKSQGSQWDTVILYDEWANRQTLQQWRYTGITRAAERITVVKPL